MHDDRSTTTPEEATVSVGSSLAAVAVAVALVAGLWQLERAHIVVGAPPNLPPWSAAPFVLLLLCIAVLPLAARDWWESNWHKLLVCGAFAAVVGGYLAYLGPATGGETVR